MSPFLVSTDWLADRLADADVSIVDASWYLPAMEREAAEEFDRAHIPGAVFFDLDAVSDQTSPLPHMLPSPARFADAVGGLGIAHTDTIVVYDGPGLFSAPRAWWMFRVMGAPKVVILDGGFSKWIDDRLPVESGVAPQRPRTFDARLDGSKVVGLDEMRRLVDGGAVIADARPAGRFFGAEPEPREGMRSGHMPGAINVPFSNLQRDGRLKPVTELRALFDGAGIGTGTPVVTTCGSGVTAATIALALETVGNANHRLYDGSWSEWGALSDTPVEAG